MTEHNHPYLTPALWEIVHAARRLALHADTIDLLCGEDDVLRRDLEHACYVLRQVLIEETRLWGLTREELDMAGLQADKYQSALDGTGTDVEAAMVFGG